MEKPNEKNAREALIEIFNKKYSKDLILDSKPDEKNRKTKDIDWIMHDCTKKYAIEHTIIEKYIGQKEYVLQSYEITKRINEKCTGKLPNTNYFFLLLPYQLIYRKKKPDNEKLINELTMWVIKEACNMNAEDSVYCFYNGAKVSLICNNDENIENGNVYRAPCSPDDCDELLVKRFDKVITDKLGKITKYKCKKYQTVLLLEDISGSFMFGIPQKKIGIINKLKIWLRVDYIIILVSLNDKMVVGNIWKEKGMWYKIIPLENRFDF